MIKKKKNLILNLLEIKIKKCFIMKLVWEKKIWNWETRGIYILKLKTNQKIKLLFNVVYPKTYAIIEIVLN